MKAILLARVSSKEQEEGQSIPAQVRRLKEYAAHRNLTVEYVFQITESSTKETRKEFEKILILLRKSKEKMALIADTIDRVQRSFKESVALDELRKNGKVEVHFYRENLVLHEKSNSADLLRWDMGVMFARSYVLQLSDNVKRSKEEGLKKGIWVGLAPFGYQHAVDVQGRKTIIPDPGMALCVRKMFELYGSGHYSLQTLSEEMGRMGYETSKGRKFAKSQVEAILKNPFYYGAMHTKYGIFDHAYEPLITRTLFEQVQAVTDRYHKIPFQHGALQFVLRGFITCGHCGCMVSPEIKKKKYIYYSCTNAKGGCSREYIREEELMKQLTPYFDNIQLSDQQIEEITHYLKEIHESESVFHKENVDRLRREQDKIQLRISKMYDDKLDGLIDTETYCLKLKEYKDKQYEILEQMQRHTVADEKFHITASTVMSLAQRAPVLFESSEVSEKRQILDLVFQNLRLEDKKLALELREPFLMLSEIKGRPMNWGWVDSNYRKPKLSDLQSSRFQPKQHASILIKLINRHLW